MRNRAWNLVLWSALAFGGNQIAWAQSLTIDDFTTGKHKVTLKSGSRDDYQRGSMIGGVRETFFFLNPQNPFDQTCTLEIQPQGTLLINAGLRLFGGLSLVYGESPGGQDALLNLNLAPYDRLRLEIDAVDVGLSLTVVLFSGNGNSASAIVSIPDSNSPYNLDIPFSSFTENPGAPINRGDIDKIAFVFQSGSAVSGDDFAIRAIRVMEP